MPIFAGNGPAGRASAAEPVRIAGLADLHADAAKARDAGDQSELERLRLDRLQLLQKAPERSPWTEGVRALGAAEGMCRRMRYKAAAEVLKKAWEPFAASPGGGTPVLGDLALKMFEVHQAALAVFPPTHSEFPALSKEDLRLALEIAIAADPCQVEAHAAQAFLTEPKPDESFQPAELQPSLVARNRDLLGISFTRESQVPILPWHAAVEFLKAKSSSFVLDDLDYLDTFLDPRFRIQGTDRRGESFCTVLGGGLLVNDTELRSGRSRRYVLDYVTAEKYWRRFRPVMMVVASEDVKPKAWSLDESDACGRIDANLARVIDLATDEADRQLKAIVAEFPDDVERAVRVIRAGKWQETTQEQGPGPGAPFVEQLAFIQVQFDRYGTNFPKHRQAATQAMKELTPLIERLKQLAGVRASLQACFVPEYTQAGSPSPPRMISSAKVSREELPRTLAAIAAVSKELRAIDGRLLEYVPPEKSERPAKDAKVGRPPREAANRKQPAASAKSDPPVQVARASADGPTGDRLRLESLELLKSLRFIAHLRAVADPAVVSAVNSFVSAASQGWSGGDEEDADVGMRAKIAQVDQSKRKFLDVMQQIQAGDVQPGQSQVPFRLSAKLLDTSVDAVTQMLAGAQFFGGLPTVDAAQRLERFVQECLDVKATTDIMELLARWESRADPVQQWKVAGYSWKVYEVPDGLPLEDLADMLESGMSIALAEESFDRLARECQKGDRPTQVPLIASATRMSDNPLVEEKSESPVLRLEPARALAPIYSIALIAEGQTPGVQRWEPAYDVDERGRHVLAVQDRGQTLTLVLDTDSMTPTISVEYPGAQGVQALGVHAGSGARHRALKDRRGNFVSRAVGGSPSPFRIVTSQGVQLTDRAVNYAWQDWRDLDRNIVNTFMPNAFYLGPSLPVWLAYRRELTRPSPAGSFLWGVPRQAYR